jgi:hypothetical protein
MLPWPREAELRRRLDIAEPPVVLACTGRWRPRRIDDGSAPAGGGARARGAMQGGGGARAWGAMQGGGGAGEEGDAMG